MAVFQDLIVAVYAAGVYITIFAVCAYGLSSYASYRRLGHIKGPFLAGWSNFWLVKTVYNLNTHQELYQVNKKYGSLARVGPNMLVTSDPNIIHRMNRARSGYTKSVWYEGIRMQPGHDNVFSTVDEKVHAQRRAQMAMGYSGKENPGVEDRINKHLSNFINLIRTKYISTETELRPMDLARKAQFVTLDIITDLAFNVPFGDLDHDEDVHLYIQSTEETMQVAIMLSTIPVMNSFVNLPIIGDLIFPSSKDKTGPGRLIRVAEEVVKKRYKEDPKGTQMDMMGSFMRHGVKEFDAVAESLLQILAGADTTGTATRATMLFVMTNPRVYRRLQVEIDNYLKVSNLPQNQIIPSKDAETMPYLQAVIREGLRIWPPVTGLLPKKTPPEGDTISGVFIPGGTDIGYCAWGVHRNRDVFGSDSELFRPERWLEAKGEKLATMEKTIDLVFGHGKYQCLGQNIAWMELNKLFFELMRNFEWSIIDPTNPWTSGNVGLWLQKNLWVRVSEREYINSVK